MEGAAFERLNTFLGVDPGHIYMSIHKCLDSCWRGHLAHCHVRDAINNDSNLLRPRGAITLLERLTSHASHTSHLTCLEGFCSPFTSKAFCLMGDW